MADEKAPAEKAPEKTTRQAVEKAPEPVVVLYAEPHARFELSGMGLEDLVPEGTGYSARNADIVRTLCRKYGVRFREAQSQ
jgi:hypothetical protein